MQWTYQITAASRPRVLMRIVQAFDQQNLLINSLTLTLFDDRVNIRITVDVEIELAQRILAKLYNQTDIQNVDHWELVEERSNDTY